MNNTKMEMISIVKLMMTFIVMKMEMVMALRIIAGGGWCLEWLHPPPKGVQRKGREREKER